jgi:hypothetical protein
MSLLDSGVPHVSRFSRHGDFRDGAGSPFKPNFGLHGTLAGLAVLI